MCGVVGWCEAVAVVEGAGPGAINVEMVALKPAVLETDKIEGLQQRASEVPAERLRG